MFLTSFFWFISLFILSFFTSRNFYFSFQWINSFVPANFSELMKPDQSIWYISRARRRYSDGVFDVFLHPHGFKKLPLSASVPSFYQSETQHFRAHLLIGIESRTDSGSLCSRWIATATEVENQGQSHLELKLKSFVSGQSALSLLLELGRYLRCTRADIIQSPCYSLIPHFIKSD